MRTSKSEIYLHFVWATHRREPLIGPQIEQAVYGCILNEIRSCKAELLAIGGAADHVHLLVKMPTPLSAASLMQRVKGVSSTLGRRLIEGGTFGWQDGYGVFSISRSHLKRVTAYVQNQKARHADDKLWGEWEETDVEVDEILISGRQESAFAVDT